MTQAAEVQSLFWRFELNSHCATQRPLPAELLYEAGGILGDLLGELDHVDASQNDVVGFHWVWA